MRAGAFVTSRGRAVFLGVDGGEGIAVGIWSSTFEAGFRENREADTDGNDGETATGAIRGGGCVSGGGKI